MSRYCPPSGDWNLPWGGILGLSGWSGLKAGPAGASGDVAQSGASADSTWKLWAVVTVGTWSRTGPPSDGRSPSPVFRGPR